MTDYSELMCQIFDDLAVEETLPMLSQANYPENIVEPIAEFVKTLNDYDRQLGERDADLEAADWLLVRKAACTAAAAMNAWNSI